ncbi:polyprenyl synthetase family protein [Clostridium sp. UBA7503]|uniref:polyprenyl synthetase family protein n=1 Tax=Clostridium sp. UBA7503 TaxID=1946377 RepID=UPI003216435C
MELYEHFKNYYNKNEEKLHHCVYDIVKENIQRSFLGHTKLLQYLKEPYLNSFFGGKHLRGILVCIGFQMFGGNINKDVISAGAAYEVFQTSILLHDDIIDNSDERRGKPSLHKSIENLGNSREKAAAMTICLGDYGLEMVYKIIMETGFSCKTKLDAMASLNENVSNTIIGQMIDIELADYYHEDKIDIEERILEVAKYKTAYYTVTGPMTLGAVLAGADHKSSELLQNFGQYLGIAFQVQDDIIGIYGEDTGKPTDSDIKENKITVLFHYAMKNSSECSKKTLISLYGNKNITSNEIEEVKRIFIQCGALEYACNIRDEYKNKAIDILNQITVCKEIKDVLLDTIEFLINRQK